MVKAKIEKLLDDLTLGLKADPEIRLDVKSELRSHLDAKIEEGIQAGLSEEESEEQALKAFGDTIQISDGIADANTAKISLKAKLKVFAGILLIPAVIICALISFEYSILGASLSLNALSNPDAFLHEMARNKNKVFWSFQRYTQEEKFILYGDKSKKTKVAQQKAIWERFPKNKVYLANYILTLLAKRKDNQDWRKKMFSELKMAEQIDPDNAIYNYITTGLLLSKACDVKSNRINIPKEDRKNYKLRYFIEIKDQELMDQALVEYLKGTRKKYFNPYIMVMHHQRLNIMGQPKNVVENMRQMAVAASLVVPHLKYLRHVPRALWSYAEILQKQGKQQEALKIIAPWKTYIKHITENSNTLIGIFVDTAVAVIAEEKIPKIYRKAGKIKLAENAKKELTKIVSPVKKWKADMRRHDIMREQLAKAGMLASMLLPALGKMDYTEEDFAVSNKIEYTAVEKSGIMLLNVLFMISMIVSLLTAPYWRIRSKQKALLLAPSLRLVGKIFLSGIVLPLTAYVLISISGIVGGHEYNIIYNALSLASQFIILLTIIPTIIFILIRKYVHKRCLELDITCPEIKQSKAWRVILIIIFSILALLALAPIPIIPSSALTASSIVIGSSAVVVLILYILILITKYLISLSLGKKYALYYGALAKTLTPVFALAMIFMTLIVIPYLNWRETDLISKDKVMYGRTMFFTPAEYQVTQRLKAAILKALE